MTTHALHWDGIRNRLEVITVEEMLSRNRIAYTEELPAFPVPIYIGTEAECRDGAAACAATITQRAQAHRQRLGVLEARPARVLDEPVPLLDRASMEADS